MNVNGFVVTVHLVFNIITSYIKSAGSLNSPMLNFINIFFDLNYSQ